MKLVAVAQKNNFNPAFHMIPDQGRQHCAACRQDQTLGRLDYLRAGPGNFLSGGNYRIAAGY